MIVIVDNLDAAFSTTGTWSSSSSGNASMYGSSFLFAGPFGSGSNTATWLFTGLTAGKKYALAVVNSQNAGGPGAFNATFAILDSNGSTHLLDKIVNQFTGTTDFVDAGVNWINLGEVTPSGSSLSVFLTDDADNFVLADAVRLQDAAAGNTPATAPELVGTLNTGLLRGVLHGLLRR